MERIRKDFTELSSKGCFYQKRKYIISQSLSKFSFPIRVATHSIAHLLYLVMVTLRSGKSLSINSFDSSYAGYSELV